MCRLCPGCRPCLAHTAGLMSAPLSCRVPWAHLAPWVQTRGAWTGQPHPLGLFPCACSIGWHIRPPKRPPPRQGQAIPTKAGESSCSRSTVWVFVRVFVFVVRVVWAPILVHLRRVQQSGQLFIDHQTHNDQYRDYQRHVDGAPHGNWAYVVFDDSHLHLNQPEFGQTGFEFVVDVFSV